MARTPNQLTPKQKLQAEAKELGVDFKEENTIPELEKLIADKKAERGASDDDSSNEEGGAEGEESSEGETSEGDTDSDEEGATEEDSSEENDEAPGKGATAYVKSHGRIVRTYTKEKHGKDFKKLAEEYSESHGGGFDIVVE